MRKILTFSALASLLALQGCMGPKPGSPEAKALVVQEMQEQKAEAVEETVSDIPSWCIELPKSNVGKILRRLIKEEDARVCSYD